MPDDETASCLDAVRLLASAIIMAQHEVRRQEALTPYYTYSEGEQMLADALTYLAHGDTREARKHMDDYDHWKATGELPPDW